MFVDCLFLAHVLSITPDCCISFLQDQSICKWFELRRTACSGGRERFSPIFQFLITEDKNEHFLRKLTSVEIVFQVCFNLQSSARKTGLPHL